MRRSVVLRRASSTSIAVSMRWAIHLDRASRFGPALSPERYTDLFERVPAWVDYEPSIIRTLGNARFDTDDTPAGRALLPDLLLAAGGKPVVGEVKIAADKPFVR